MSQESESIFSIYATVVRVRGWGGAGLDPLLNINNNIYISHRPNPLLSHTCLQILAVSQTCLAQTQNIRIKKDQIYQQLLITNMIKRNKLKYVVRLPRIPPALEAHHLGKEDLIIENYAMKQKNRAQSSVSKENSTPKDLRNNTIYLQFPIGRKKCTQESPYQVKGENLTQESMFISRAACSNFRKDVRTIMFKYDEQRAQSLTERTNNYCSVAQQLILRQMTERNHKKQKVQDKKKDQKYAESRQKATSVKRKYRFNENVSRWNDFENRNVLQQSNDSLFEQIVEQSKILRMLG